MKAGKVVIRKPFFNYRNQTIVDETLMTKQSHKDECDVNLIIRDFTKNGNVPITSGRVAGYYDASSMSFQDAMNFINNAQREFEDLPSAIRKRFGNDPDQFVQFIGDPDNRDEAIKLGLIEPPVGS